jgi:hypothetical protein
MVPIVIALVVLAQALPSTDSGVVIAAGRRIEAQLDQPVSARTVSASDTVVMSVSHKLLVGSRLALPAGTRIVATIDSITRASALRNHLDLHMRLVQMAFADGDSIALGQSVLGKSSDGEWLHVENAHQAPQVIALAAPVAERGAPIDLVLDAPLVFDRAQLMAAEEYAAALPAFKPPTRPKLCFVVGAPGTPDITIPGSPPFPGIDGTPETPGTPTIVLPGTPATPDSWVPC